MSRRMRGFFVAFTLLLPAFALSAVAIAGDERPLQTDSVLAQIEFPGEPESTLRVCEGQDATTYVEESGTVAGRSTGDPRLSGDVLITFRTLQNLDANLRTDVGRIVIRDPATGRKKAEGSFSNASRERISQGTIVGRVYDHGTGSEETTGAGRLVANWRSTFGETEVTAQIGGTASDGRLPAVVQSGRCPDGGDDE